MVCACVGACDAWGAGASHRRGARARLHRRTLSTRARRPPGATRSSSSWTAPPEEDDCTPARAMRLHAWSRGSSLAPACDAVATRTSTTPAMARASSLAPRRSMPAPSRAPHCALTTKNILKMSFKPLLTRLAGVRPWRARRSRRPLHRHPRVRLHPRGRLHRSTRELHRHALEAGGPQPPLTA